MKDKVENGGDLINGRIDSKINIPGYGQYDYPTYFWTIPYAIHIIKKHFNLKECKEIKNNLYILTFIKYSSP